MSFPSGHTTTAVVFFLGFAILALRAPLPPGLDAVLVAALVLCTLAVPWSRLALGAHYATDIAGGALFGAAWLCATFAAIAWIYGRAHA
jgi:undecaprenyl-diphosphatase